MSLAGTGAVAIWHDMAPEGRSEFYAWHGREHMPERTSIPGFLRGRRYVAIGGQPEFFNLYETDSPRTIVGPDYRARLNQPTAWTLSTVKHFRGVARSLCEVAASFGEGVGGMIATFRYAIDDARADDHRRRMSEVALPVLADAGGVAGCHLLVADTAASALATAESKVRTEKNLIPGWIVLVESWDDVESFKALCAEWLAAEAFEDVSGTPALSIYRLQYAVAKLPPSAG